MLLVDGEQWAHAYSCKYMIYMHVLYVHVHYRDYPPTQMRAHTHTHAHPTHISEQLHSTGTSDFLACQFRNLALNPTLPGTLRIISPQVVRSRALADNFALRLLLLFDQLREVASSRRSELPDDDPVATLELIIFFLGSVQTQIQHMQVSLLES